jgi:undecaprenyl-diphosphatase
MLTSYRKGLYLAAGLTAGAAILAILLAVPVTRAWIQAADEQVAAWTSSIQNRPATLLAEAMSLLGGVWVTWPLRVAVFARLAMTGRRLQLAAFALAVVTSEVLIGVGKVAYHRPRPPGALVETTGYSFPSGHAIVGAVTAVGLVVVLLPPGRRRWRWELWAVVFTTVMALSRVYLHAHWLSDVVAGALLGAGIGLGWPAVLMALVPRKRVAEAAA